MGTPRISIVTPSFNQGRFIENAITSVLSQRYSNFEHIIVDNCSTDDTITILKKYPHLKWVSEPDEGQSDALNKGFKIATGDIIGWLNADEMYLPGLFSMISKMFGEDKGVDVVYGDTLLWFIRENVVRKKKAFRFSYPMLRYWGMFFNTSSTFIKRRFIDEEEFLNPSFAYHMDHEFVLRLARKGYKFSYMPSSFSIFCVHSLSKTSSGETLSKRLVERHEISRKYGMTNVRPAFQKIAHKLIEWGYSSIYGTVRWLTNRFVRVKWWNTPDGRLPDSPRFSDRL